MKKTTLFIAAFTFSALAAFGQAAVPNNGFETWAQTFGGPEEPTNWVTSNTFANPLLTFPNPNPNPTSVFKAGSPDNYAGSFSMKIVTVDLSYNPDPATVPDTLGVAMLGSVSTAAPYLLEGKPYTSRPAQVSYYTKYMPTGSDTAWCFVQLSRWNGSSRDIVAEGWDFLPNAVTSYTQRTIVLDYLSFANPNAPDTLRITFSSSASLGGAMPGSTYFIDDLQVSGWVGMSENEVLNAVNVFPNPASNEVKFVFSSDKASKVEVYDMAGRTVSVVDVQNRIAKEQLFDYAAGLYNYAVLDEEKAVINRGKFTVVK